jgi:RimJ/RimL family protein N-acetyltransferase
MRTENIVLLSETERLLIRPFCLDDVPELTSILSDPEVMRYSVRGICDDIATREFIKWCLSCYSSHGVGPWALINKASTDLIGFCGIGPEIVEDAEEMNLGYRLARQYWGAGLASESSRAVLDYAFTKKHLDSVVVIIEPEHIASMRVAEKVGFRDYKNIEFHEKPVRLYRLSHDQWNTMHNQSFQRTSL